MSFTKASPKTPTSIGALIITVAIDVEDFDEDGNPITKNYASYDVEIKDENGHRMHSNGDSGDLIPVLTDSEKTQIMAFMQAQKDKAIAGFL